MAVLLLLQILLLLQLLLLLLIIWLGVFSKNLFAALGIIAGTIVRAYARVLAASHATSTI